MTHVRQATPDDRDGLVELARAAGYGFTTLSPDPDRIAQRLDADAQRTRPLLVLEDPASPGEILGCAGMFTRVGDPVRVEPFYAYRLEKSIHQSARLDVRTEVDALHLVAQYDGPSEVGTLLLRPDRRGGGLGRLLSLSRFLYIASRREQFQRHVIAELRGIVDERGHSPFWEGLGRHFFQVEYDVADRLSAVDKQFIAELMPRHPIYLPVLPKAARHAVGRVHPDTAPAKRLLEAEGFHSAGMVDIFDAGPILWCDIEALRTVRESRVGPAQPADDPGRDAAPTLIASAEGPFVGVLAPARWQGETLHAPAQALATVAAHGAATVLAAPAKANPLLSRSDDPPTDALSSILPLSSHA
ncbi:MAG: arginine N-succinyltransferase [Planctomycetota bacterium]